MLTVGLTPAIHRPYRLIYPVPGTHAVTELPQFSLQHHQISATPTTSFSFLLNLPSFPILLGCIAVLHM